MNTLKNKNGFTLIELLLIILIIGIMAITAVGSYISTAENFTFLSDFNFLTSTFKKARSLAITNVKNDTVSRYGIAINKNTDGSNYTYSVFIFEDLATGIPYNYDSGAEADPIVFESEYHFNKDFEISLNNITSSFNYYIYYENGTGEVSAYQSPSGTPILIPKNDQDSKYLEFKFNAIDNSIARYIVLSQISGLAESFRNSQLTQ